MVSPDVSLQRLWVLIHLPATTMDLTPEFLQLCCRDTDGCYGTAELNDKLYIHYKGFNKIENLEKYTGLKALWLEGNGISSIEGLENQSELRTLFLQENCLEEIEGLEKCVKLDTLNLSKNFISKIDNLATCQQLTTLIMSFNHLKVFDVEQFNRPLILTNSFGLK